MLGRKLFHRYLVDVQGTFCRGALNIDQDWLHLHDALLALACNLTIREPTGVVFGAVLTVHQIRSNASSQFQDHEIVIVSFLHPASSKSCKESILEDINFWSAFTDIL